MGRSRLSFCPSGRGKYGSVRPEWFQGLGNTDGPIMAAMSKTRRAMERSTRRLGGPSTLALPLPRLSALLAAPLPRPAGVDAPA